MFNRMIDFDGDLSVAQGHHIIWDAVCVSGKFDQSSLLMSSSFCFCWLRWTCISSVWDQTVRHDDTVDGTEQTAPLSTTVNTHRRSRQHFVTRTLLKHWIHPRPRFLDTPPRLLFASRINSWMADTSCFFRLYSFRPNKQNQMSQRQRKVTWQSKFSWVEDKYQTRRIHVPDKYSIELKEKEAFQWSTGELWFHAFEKTHIN